MVHERELRGGLTGAAAKIIKQITDMLAGISVRLIFFASADEGSPDNKLVSTAKRRIRFRTCSIEDFDSRMRGRASWSSRYDGGTQLIRFTLTR